MDKQQNDDKAKKIEITVNGKSVVVHDDELTGMQIKQAAIDQGVNIRIDFILFEDLNNGQQVVVKDNQTVKLHNQMKFDAVTNDDNS